jgi:hypothetical protein
MESTEGKIENEISPELVERIENSKLDVESKVNLLLVKAEAKPSSILDITIRTGENVWLDPKDLNEVESILRETGLAFDVGEVLTEGSGEDEEKKDRSKTLDTVEILISKSKEGIEQMREIRRKMPSRQQVERGEYTEEQRIGDYKALGLAFGYPESAVNAFAGEDGRKLLNTDTLPDEIKKSDAFVFSEFKLSEDGWQNELRQGQLRADTIKRISPKTYQEMMAK